ncbi:MAG: hypothetical protein NTX82_03385 [Candidatus Parcubacteria bacterium]|nr:hypothetical protein [Candidatus Parcubacteria bacterium]
MTMYAYLPETHLKDGKGGKRLVRPGDQVDLMPADLRKTGDETEDYFIPEDIASLHRWMGKGPYNITGIGQWPCGKIVLVLKTSKSNGFAVDASKFM